jgi:hypothetical protein
MGITGTIPTKVKVRKNSTVPDVGARPRINLIEGANINITAVDDPAADEVDVTLASTPGTTGEIISVNSQETDVPDAFTLEFCRFTIPAGKNLTLYNAGIYPSGI